MSWFKQARLLLLPGGNWISPGGFLRRALALVVLWLIAHLLGWREDTMLLSGTSPTGEPITFSSAMPAAIYIFLWFAAVLISPSLVIGAGFLWLVRRFRPALGCRDNIEK